MAHVKSIGHRSCSALVCGQLNVCLIDLTPPYLCLVCGYSMIERRCIHCRKNMVNALAEKTHETVMVLFGTSAQAKVLLEMRRLSLINVNGDLTPRGRELVEKAEERQF